MRQAACSANSLRQWPPAATVCPDVVHMARDVRVLTERHDRQGIGQGLSRLSDGVTLVSMNVQHLRCTSTVVASHSPLDTPGQESGRTSVAAERGRRDVQRGRCGRASTPGTHAWGRTGRASAEASAACRAEACSSSGLPCLQAGHTSSSCPRPGTYWAGGQRTSTAAVVAAGRP